MNCLGSDRFARRRHRRREACAAHAAPPQTGAGDSPSANREYNPETTQTLDESETSAKAIDYEYSNDLLTLAELEKRHILSALNQNDGNRTRTAEVLGINIRTLRNKLKEYTDAGVAID